jgi:hypothetical protein
MCPDTTVTDVSGRTLLPPALHDAATRRLGLNVRIGSAPGWQVQDARDSHERMTAAVRARGAPWASPPRPRTRRAALTRAEAPNEPQCVEFAEHAAWTEQAQRAEHAAWGDQAECAASADDASALGSAERGVRDMYVADSLRDVRDVRDVRGAGGVRGVRGAAPRGVEARRARGSTAHAHHGQLPADHALPERA